MALAKVCDVGRAESRCRRKQAVPRQRHELYANTVHAHHIIPSRPSEFGMKLACVPSRVLWNTPLISSQALGGQADHFWCAKAIMQRHVPAVWWPTTSATGHFLCPSKPYLVAGREPRVRGTIIVTSTSCVAVGCVASTGMPSCTAQEQLSQ